MNIAKIYNKKRILITGHTGFKGVWLTKILEKYKCELFGISLKNNQNDKLFKKIKKHLKIKSFFFDIKNENRLKKTLENINPDYIFHFAAQSLVIKSFKNKKLTFDSNIVGSLSLIKSLKNLKQLKKIFFITTDKVYLNQNKKKFLESDYLGGEDPYSLSKVVADFIFQYYDHYLKKKRIKCFIIRSGNIFGGGDFGQYRLINDYFSKKQLKIRSINSTRPFQFIVDALFKYLILGKLNKDSIDNLIWNIGPNKTFKVIEIINFLKKFHKRDFIISKEKFLEKKHLSLSNKKFKKKFKNINETNIKDSLKLTSEIYLKFNRNSKYINMLIEKNIKFFLKQNYEKKFL